MAVRTLSLADLPAVCRLDARLTGTRKSRYWRHVFDRFLNADDPRLHIGLATDNGGGRITGYLFGEVRAVEFGSEPCGWIFAVGVDARQAHRGIGSALVTEACARFRAAGVITVRTMVNRGDIPMLSFFRTNGFVGGSYVQLETHITQE